mmetsp:Transcript_16305/g.41540  ORF Transcript_16305/g.41540 Transcript_16305/m.41540 type:complete len:361 (-) Transcript_16305:333-1415(-)
MCLCSLWILLLHIIKNLPHFRVTQNVLHLRFCHRTLLHRADLLLAQLAAVRLVDVLDATTNSILALFVRHVDIKPILVRCERVVVVLQKELGGSLTRVSLDEVRRNLDAQVCILQRLVEREHLRVARRAIAVDEVATFAVWPETLESLGVVLHGGGVVGTLEALISLRLLLRRQLRINVRLHLRILLLLLCILKFLQRVGVAVLGKCLVEPVDALVEVTLLDVATSNARHRARDRLVVRTVLTPHLDRLLAVLDRLGVLRLLKLHRRAVAQEADLLRVERDGSVVVLNRDIEVLRLVRGVSLLLLSKSGLLALLCRLLLFRHLRLRLRRGLRRRRRRGSSAASRPLRESCTTHGIFDVVT